MATKNILITTLNETRDFEYIRYYSAVTDQGEYRFCTGISNAEAGTKFMLSNYKIDKIFVIGPTGIVDEDKTLVEIKNSGVPTRIDYNSVNEFEFYCYRISQFLNRIDIEAADNLFSANEEKQELSDLITKIVPRRPEGYFYSIAENKELYKEIKRQMGEDWVPETKRIQKHLLYSKMDSYCKMHPLKNNDGVTVEYIGLENTADGELSAAQLFRLVEKMTPDNQDSINVYMDLQGMDKADSYSIWNVMNVSGKMNHRFSLQAIICTKEKPGNFTHEIINEKKRYNIDAFVSGLSAFLQYGRTELLTEYFDKENITHRLLKNMLAAMKYIDTGVSLNNSTDLDYGLKALKHLLEQDDDDEMTDTEQLVLSVLKSSIKRDYGKLLSTPEIEITNLIEWALHKGFYQQALTMTEALVPEDMVRRGIYFYASDHKELDDFKDFLNTKYWLDNTKNRYVYQDISHLFIKSFGRDIVGFCKKELQNKEFTKLRIRMLHEKCEHYPLAHSNLNNDDMLFELLLSYYNVGTIRNSVSHASGSLRKLSSFDEIEEVKSYESIVNALNIFLGLYRSACRRLEKSDAPKPLMLSQSEFRSYIRLHRLEAVDCDQDGNLDSKYVTCSFDGRDINVKIQMLKIEEHDPNEDT